MKSLIKNSRKTAIMILLLLSMMMITVMPQQVFAGTTYTFVTVATGPGSGNISVYKEIKPDAWQPVDAGEKIDSDARLKIKVNPDKYSDVDNNNVAIMTATLMNPSFHVGTKDMSTPLIYAEDENRQIIPGEYIYDPARVPEEHDAWKKGNKGISIGFKIKDTNTKSIEGEKRGEGDLALYLKDGLRTTPAKRAREGDTILVSADAKSGWTLSGLYLLEKDAAAPSAPYEIKGDFKIYAFNNDMYQVTMPEYDAKVYAVFTSGDTPSEKRTVKVSGIKGEDKSYDGKDDAGFSYKDLNIEGLVEGDEVGVTASGRFVDVNAGKNKLIDITGLTLTGANKDKYEIDFDNSQKTTEAEITPKIAELAADNKFVYDGKEHFPTARVTNLIEGDTCDVTMEGTPKINANVAEFGDKSEPEYTAKVVALTNKNYRVKTTQTFQFYIKKKPIKITADDKEGSLAQKPELTWTMENEQENWLEENRAEIAFALKKNKGEFFDIDHAPAGVYSIEPSWKTENTNYNATFEDGKCILHGWEEGASDGTPVEGKTPGEPGYIDFRMEFSCNCGDHGSYEERAGAHWTVIETADEYKIELQPAPTCTSKGAYAYRFKGTGPDGKEYDKRIFVDTPATGHVWDGGKVTTKPTEKATGTRTYTCIKCKATRKASIPKMKPAVPPAGRVVILNTIANSAKRTNDVIWDRSGVRGATGYEINWKAWGGKKWVKRIVGDRARGTTSGLTVGNLYEIRVRPRNSDKYGIWSNTVYRYFHTVEKIRLTSKSRGSFTISWKKNPKATGYQVMFSTKSNCAGAAKNIHNVYGNRTAFTKKGLKSGRTYYVQVREIRRVGNRNYIGNTSCPVAVKVR